MKKYDLISSSSENGAEQDKSEPAGEAAGTGEDGSPEASAFVHPYEKAMSQLSGFMTQEYQENTDKTRNLIKEYNSVLKFPSISKVVFGSFPETTTTQDSPESVE